MITMYKDRRIMKGTLRCVMNIMVCCISISLISGCFRKSKLKYEPVSYYYEHEQDGVQVEVEIMPDNQIKEIFGVNFLKSGIVPIVLTIDNQTSDALLLRGQSVHLALEDPYKVAEMVQYNTLLITASSAYLSCIFFWPALLPSLGAGVYMAHANKVITNSVCSQGFADEDSLDILPYEHISRVLFVPINDFMFNFRLHLFNVHAKTFLPFTVALEETTWTTEQETILARLIQS